MLNLLREIVGGRQHPSDVFVLQDMQVKSLIVKLMVKFYRDAGRTTTIAGVFVCDCAGRVVNEFSTGGA